jgi:hypothetical protein
MSEVSSERFSGHESFVCRYGWLPKIFRAISATPTLLKNEELAMTTLGIGRNMVKSLQFWAESSAIIETDSNGGHRPSRVGVLLFGSDGWDPYLESVESLWLIHWRLTTCANLAAWNAVFGEGKLIRFDRSRLVAALSQRGAGSSRTLAVSTLEQHASILINSYLQSARNNDDTSWCPLQDLGVLKVSSSDDGRLMYNSGISAPVGLSARVFGLALVDYITRQKNGSGSVDLKTVLRGDYSPGIVFRMDEHELRQNIENIVSGPLGAALRFVDTADTQSLVLDAQQLDPQHRAWVNEEMHEHA